MVKKKEKEKKIIKVVYFDEGSASDYITIQNGGQIDWTTKDNKEKLAKIVAEIDAQTKGGFNFFTAIKASMSSQVASSFDGSTSRLIESTISNSLITDYLTIAKNDKNIIKFHNDSVYAPEDSISMYRMFHSYLNVVPKDELPFDVTELNKALLNERGYYQMLLSSEDEPTCVLRFNISSFKNNYSLADLSKMNLSYYTIKVGECFKEQLSIEKEFELKQSKKLPSPESIVSGNNVVDSNLLGIYDVVLAGVQSE